MAKKKSGPKLSDPIAVELAEKFKALMPSNISVTKQALAETLATYGGDIQAMKKSASKIIRDSEARAYEIYLAAEQPASTSAINDTFVPRLTASARGKDGVNLIADNARGLNQFYLSISQSRKVRAGSALETFFDALFKNLGYPFDREHVVNGIPDFVFPSAAYFRTLSIDCIVFTSKRTLRERWRQITTEGSRGFVLYLGTMDEDAKKNDLDEMNRQKIWLVVPEDIRRERYPNQPNVISVEQFLIDSLDQGMERWRRKGVIK